jgi:hypothetical protein
LRELFFLTQAFHIHEVGAGIFPGWDGGISVENKKIS